MEKRELFSFIVHLRVRIVASSLLYVFAFVENRWLLYNFVLLTTSRHGCVHLLQKKIIKNIRHYLLSCYIYILLEFGIWCIYIICAFPSTFFFVREISSKAGCANLTQYQNHHQTQPQHNFCTQH